MQSGPNQSVNDQLTCFERGANKGQITGLISLLAGQVGFLPLLYLSCLKFMVNSYTCVTGHKEKQDRVQMCICKLIHSTGKTKHALFWWEVSHPHVTIPCPLLRELLLLKMNQTLTRRCVEGCKQHICLCAVIFYRHSKILKLYIYPFFFHTGH